MKNTSRAWELVAKEIDGELDPSEKAELEGYLALDFELAAHRQMLRAIVPVSDTDLPAADRKEALLASILEKGKTEEIPVIPDRKPLVRMRTWLAAAVMAGALAVGYWMWTSSSTEVKWEEVATRVGTRMRLELPDGTQVILNAGSKLSYPKEFARNERTVKLSGEAYFKVTASPNAPFIIQTTDMDVRVLGTELNLKAYPEDRITETALISGAVEVMLKKDGGKRIVLKPMQKVRMVKQAAATSSTPAENRPDAGQKAPEAVTIAAVMTSPDSGLQEETAWIENQLVFRDERFEDLALRIQRLYGINIVFKNTEYRDLIFSGTIRGESLDQVLRIFQKIHPFEYTLTDHEVIIN